MAYKLITDNTWTAGVDVSDDIGRCDGTGNTSDAAIDAAIDAAVQAIDNQIKELDLEKKKLFEIRNPEI
jgi:hypothetical protein